MNQKGKRIPMTVPAIGGAKQQAPVDVSQAQSRKCLGCEGELFDIAYRIGKVSAMAPGNKMGQDVTIKYEMFICRDCGLELGRKSEQKQ